MPSLVSIAINYCDSSRLTKCFESVLEQTYTNLEIICIITPKDKNDLLNKYQKDDRVRIWERENDDLVSSYNKVIQEASGEFILFLDNSCCLEHNAIEKMVAGAEASNSDIIICEYSNLSSPTNPKCIHFPREKVPVPFRDQKNSFALIKPGLSNKLFQLNLIRKNHIEFIGNDRYIGDVSFLFLCLHYANKINTLGEYLLQCENRVLLSCWNLKFRENLFKEIDYLYKQLKKRGINNLFKQYADVSKGYFDLIFWISKRNMESEIFSLFLKHLSEDAFSCIFTQNMSDRSTKAVSIVMPVYNAQKYIRRCMDSLCQQTLKNIEIICIDDGSTDDSLKILKEYEKKDNRVIVVHQENKGQSIARNKGIEIAGGEYIQFVDADDYLEPDACKYLYIYSNVLDLDMCPLVAFVHHGDEVSEPWRCYNYFLKALPDTIPTVFNRDHLGEKIRNLCHAPWATFYSRTFLLKYAIHFINKRLTYGGDVPFFIAAMLKANKMGAVTIPLYHYCFTSEGSKVAFRHQKIAQDPFYYIEYTFDLINQLGNRRLFDLFYDFYTKYILDEIKMVDPKNKSLVEKYAYRFYLRSLSNYHAILPSICKHWCREYVKKSPIKSFLLNLRIFINQINIGYLSKIINIQNVNPSRIKILGIPIGSIKTEKSSKTNIRTVYIAGLPVLKIKEEP